MGISLVRRLLTSTFLLALVIGLVPATANAQSYTGAAAATWVPNGQVWSMVVTTSRIYLGGDFTRMTNPATGAVVTRNHLAAIDRNTGNPTSWAPSVVDKPAILDPSGNRTNPAVATLAAGSDGTIYVGGDFTKVGGKTRNFAAAVSKGGTVLDSWNPTITAGNGVGRVWDFARSGTKLYMVGQFGNVDGQTRSGAAMISTVDAPTNPSTLSAWDPQLTGKAQAIALSGSRVFLGGTFNQIDGRNQANLGAVDSTTGADSTWAPEVQCDVPDIECRVRDLAVDSTQVYAAIGGEPGGRAAAWNINLSTGTPTWTQEADGEVQAVTAYDGVVYFGGHFGKKFGPAGSQKSRTQFAAVSPAGTVLPFTLPFIGPSIPGIRVIQADSTGIRIGGKTQISGKPYKNFFAFARVGTTIPGPYPFTKVTVKTKGCKTCKVRVTENRGSGAVWSSGWVKAKKGTSTFNVPTARTTGLTVQVDAPWEKKMKKTTEVVMRYKGQGVGNKVTAKEAQKAKKATSCYAGTNSSALKFTVTVKKVKSGSKVGTRAWTSKTQKFDKPIRKAPKGVLTTKKPTKCK